MVPEIHEIPLQITKSAGTTPRVFGTTHPETGAKTLSKAFTIPIHPNHSDTLHRPFPSRPMAKFMDVVQNYLPEEWDPELAWILVPIGKHIWHTLGIVICGNRTEAEMTKQYDVKLFNQKNTGYSQRSNATRLVLCDGGLLLGICSVPNHG
ncbi:hypothetical protein DFP72DRAFT_846725 [Ephemerocybe angulata]|uniref:Uncharacterized protein n=1 Tax=Ephemerocybe angulata TaxID=980116 RepID=A0A8H6M6B2_9AGAR|nr:hypothetical protein DFP72DRAFT_846725 [Tulosesus angulatus]